MNNVIELKTTGERAQLREAQKNQTLIRLWRENLDYAATVQGDIVESLQGSGKDGIDGDALSLG